MSSTQKSYSTMERGELEALKQSKLTMLKDTEQEIKKLKKKFKSGSYDRQVICEHIISSQGQMANLLTAVERINGILETRTATAGA